MADAIHLEIIGPAGKGQFAAVDLKIAAAFGHQAAICQPFEFGQNFGLAVGIDQTSQGRGLVMGGRNQTDKATIMDRADLHAPPRSASR